MSNPNNVLFRALIISLGLVLAACAEDSKQRPVTPAEAPSPHTGNEVIEEEQVNPDFQMLDETPGEVKFVYADRLRVRSTPEILEGNILGVLSTNDQVVLVSGELIGQFVEIKVVSTNSEIEQSEQYFVGASYLGDERQVIERRRSASPYFMIQNIATEYIRVYKKNCDSGDCAHELVLETGMVSGENKSGTRTVVGNFNITSWTKFYQDGAASYPSWYHPNYPSTPAPGSGVMAWTKNKIMPGGRGSVRGAFGWYTAKVGPNSHYQWTHGTIGWGVDKDKFIKATRGFFANLFADPRSHGCSRTDNESIAYIRHLLPKGTPIIKVYAMEAMGQSQSQYSESKKTWEYILTKNGAQTDGEIADRAQVLANGTARSKYLEEGSFEIDAHPDLEGFKQKGSGKRGKNGNVYQVKAADMRGAFLVDEGRLVNYKHPSTVGKGGYSDQLLPAFVVANSNTPYELPAVTKKTLKKAKR